MRGHLDAVHSLAMHPMQAQLLSSGSDHTVRLWSVENAAGGGGGVGGGAGANRLLATYTLEDEHDPNAQPTCAIFNDAGTQFLLAQTNGSLLAVDIESGKTLLRFDTPNGTHHFSLVVAIPTRFLFLSYSIRNSEILGIPKFASPGFRFGGGASQGVRGRILQKKFLKMEQCISLFFKILR